MTSKQSIAAPLLDIAMTWAENMANVPGFSRPAVTLFRIAGSTRYPGSMLTKLAWCAGDDSTPHARKAFGKAWANEIERALHRGTDRTKLVEAAMFACDRHGVKTQAATFIANRAQYARAEVAIPAILKASDVAAAQNLDLPGLAREWPHAIAKKLEDKDIDGAVRTLNKALAYPALAPSSIVLIFEHAPAASPKVALGAVTNLLLSRNVTPDQALTGAAIWSVQSERLARSDLDGAMDAAIHALHAVPWLETPADLFIAGHAELFAARKPVDIEDRLIDMALQLRSGSKAETAVTSILTGLSHKRQANHIPVGP